MSAQWRGLHNDVYRVQVGKPWWRRKWQAEWDGCRWAQRGYTRRGVLAMARLRRTHTRVNDAYVRARIIIRRNVTQREWYAARYTVTGARHSADGRGGGGAA